MIPLKSIHPRTLPVRGEMRTILSVLPDIGVDLALYVLQFIQMLDGMAGLVDDMDWPGLPKRFSIQKAERRSSVAHDELLVIVSQAPASAFILEGPQLGEAEAAIDEPVCDVQVSWTKCCPIREAFAKICAGKS